MRSRTVVKNTRGASDLAKLTCPSIAGVYERERLFRLLDAARQHSVVWIAAPAGAGKTTLVTSYLASRKLPALWYQVDAGDNDIASFFYYLGLKFRGRGGARKQETLPLLTAEYLAGLPAFTVNFFRNLFTRLPAPGMLVLDNYQEASAGQLQEMLAQGFEQIPPGSCVIVLSRERPPGALTRLCTTGRVAVLGADELKLTEDESDAIVKLRHGATIPTTAVLRRVCDETQGWAAGVVLLSEHLHRNLVVAQPADATVGGPINQNVFDYFANEIFSRSDAQTQRFLLNTALLPIVSIRVANTLTADGTGESILRDLARRNYFTTWHTTDSYEYHPLFRAFLIAQVNSSYTAEQIRTLKQACARALMSSGDEEQAIHFLLEAQEWSDALELWLDCAPRLVEQGRTQTLEAWAEHFPDAVHNHNAWMLYWRGICRMVFSPADARACFVPAFALFEKQNDATPLYLVWTAIIESFVIEWSQLIPARQWLDRYHDLSVGRSPPSKDVETASVFAYVSGLSYARFEHPDLPLYVERAERLFQHETNLDRQFMQAVGTLLPYYTWSGARIGYDKLFKALAIRAAVPDAKPLMRLHWYVYKGVYDGSTGAFEESLHMVNEGLELAKATGVHVFDQQLHGFGIWGQLCGGNLLAARSLMDRMPQVRDRGQREAFYCHYASLVSHHEGDTTRALDEARQSLTLARAGGFHLAEVSALLCLAFSLARQGDTDAALKVIVETRPLTETPSARSVLFMFFCMFGAAHIRFLRGEHVLCLLALREALAMCREIGEPIAVAYCRREDAARLYALALEHNIDPEHARAAIATYRLLPPPGFLCEQWPWPVRIYTLGNFSVVKDGAPLRFGGKAQKKPLELLRAVVAFGGREVDVDKLAAVLWSDSDADAARVTLRMTLMRLRRLIGEEAIVFEESHLTLNPKYCWLDVWALERLCDETQASLSFVDCAERLLGLYKGAFLADEDSPHLRIQRERLSSKFVRTVADVAWALEADDLSDLAIRLYQKAIEVDPLAEELYRRLMHCYARQQRPAEALALYQRCYRALTSVLSVEPSALTQALRREIQRCTV